MKLKDLLAEKRVLDTEIAKLQKERDAVEVLINRQREREGIPPEAELSFGPAYSSNGDGKQRRTRGTLKAARAVLLSLPEEFNRQQLTEKIEEDYPALVGKIRPDAIRGVLRTLTDDGTIKESFPGTKTSLARYRRLVNAFSSE